MKEIKYIVYNKENITGDIACNFLTLLKKQKKLLIPIQVR